MDLAFNEDQLLLKDSARKFLEKECDATVVREIREGDLQQSARLWARMAELGWLGLPFKEAYGGLGMDHVTLAALAEELGRVADPSPYINTVVASGLLLQDVASEAQKQKLLPQIIAGSLLISFAVLEADAVYAANSIALKATQEGDVLKLNGRKMFVENANIADYLMVAVRSSEIDGQGISLLLVDPKLPGIEITPLKSVTLTDLSAVKFNDVSINVDQLLGEKGQAWNAIEKSVKTAATIQCAAAAGGASKVLEMTVEYAKERRQFDSPIGSFQAIQHMLADMYGDVETAWLAAFEAGCAIDKNADDRDAKIAMAKSFCAEAFTRCCLNAHQVFGGMGYMWETDLHYWTRKAKECELSWGTPMSYRKALAQFL